MGSEIFHHPVPGEGAQPLQSCYNPNPSILPVQTNLPTFRIPEVLALAVPPSSDVVPATSRFLVLQGHSEIARVMGQVGMKG